MSGRILGYLAVIGIIASVLVSGCAQSYDLALKFEPDDLTVYKVITEEGYTHKFEQPAKNEAEEKQKWNRSTMTFSQRVKDVDEQGSAVVDVTIEQFKYYSKGLKSVIFDFDSERPEDSKKPLAKLIGADYTIEVNPAGQISVVDASTARNAVRFGGRAAKVAKKLLSDDSIKKRHQCSLALPDTGQSRIKVGGTWKRIQPTPVRMLMDKTYEKTYSFQKVIDRAGRKVAIVDMDANAVSSGAGQGAKAMAMFAAIIGSQAGKDGFQGRLELNLDNGKVEKYSETLLSEWIAEDKLKGDDVKPARLTMGYQYLYSVEMIE